MEILGELKKISIHALREEGDEVSFPSERYHFDFYPRPPRGGRLNCNNAPSNSN